MRCTLVSRLSIPTSSEKSQEIFGNPLLRQGVSAIVGDMETLQDIVNRMIRESRERRARQAKRSADLHEAWHTDQARQAREEGTGHGR